MSLSPGVCRKVRIHNQLWHDYCFKRGVCDLYVIHGSDISSCDDAGNVVPDMGRVFFRLATRIQGKTGQY